jgi:hypothetical protein
LLSTTLSQQQHTTHADDADEPGIERGERERRSGMKVTSK